MRTTIETVTNNAGGPWLAFRCDINEKEVYQRFYAPIFADYGIRATAAIQTQVPDDDTILGSTDDYKMTWAYLQQLIDEGWDVASHGYEHKWAKIVPGEPLAAADMTELELELVQSKAYLDANLSVPTVGYIAPQHKIAIEALEVLRRAGYQWAGTQIDPDSTPKNFPIDLHPLNYMNRIGRSETDGAFKAPHTSGTFDHFQGIGVRSKINPTLMTNAFQEFIVGGLASFGGQITLHYIVDTGLTYQQEEAMADADLIALLQAKMDELYPSYPDLVGGQLVCTVARLRYMIEWWLAQGWEIVSCAELTRILSTRTIDNPDTRCGVNIIRNGALRHGNVKSFITQTTHIATPQGALPICGLAADLSNYGGYEWSDSGGPLSAFDGLECGKLKVWNAGGWPGNIVLGVFPRQTGLYKLGFKLRKGTAATNVKFTVSPIHNEGGYRVGRNPYGTYTWATPTDNEWHSCDLDNCVGVDLTQPKDVRYIEVGVGITGLWLQFGLASADGVNYHEISDIYLSRVR